MNDFLKVEKQEAKLKHLLEDFSEADKQLINQALELAKNNHAGQERHEKGPYIIHPIRTACSLIEELGVKNPKAICAALLHDAIEDTDLDIETIINKWGARVGEIVIALTRVREKDETEKNRYERKYQHHIKIMRSDKEIRTVKTCDFLDNVRSWPYISKNHFAVKRLKRWFKEGENMYLPLAESVSPKMAEKMKNALAQAHRKWDKHLKTLDPVRNMS